MKEINKRKTKIEDINKAKSYSFEKNINRID